MNHIEVKWGTLETYKKEDGWKWTVKMWRKCWKEMSNYVWEVSLSCMIRPKTPLHNPTNKTTIDSHHRWLLFSFFLYIITSYESLLEIPAWNHNNPSQSSLILKDSPISASLFGGDLADFSQTYFENLFDTWRWLYLHEKMYWRQNIWPLV